MVRPFVLSREKFFRLWCHKPPPRRSEPVRAHALGIDRLAGRRGLRGSGRPSTPDGRSMRWTDRLSSEQAPA